MSRVNTKSDLANITDVEELVRYATPLFKDIITQINGNLNFGENVFCKILDVDLSSGIETRVAHNLGRVPLMWINGSQNAQAYIYQTRVSDKSLLYLTASANVVCRILVI